MGIVTTTVEIRWDTPVLGSQFANIVRPLIEDDGKQLIVATDPDKPRFLLVGQWSPDVGDHVLITDTDPSIPGLVPDKHYTRVIVKSHGWPGPYRISSDDDRNRFTATTSLARSLEERLWAEV